jgi:hypothetical protein
MIPPRMTLINHSRGSTDAQICAMIARIALSKLAAVTLLAIVGGVPASHATPVMWQLRDVMFDGGSSASGSFIFDATTDKVLAWNIVAHDVRFANTPGCTDPSGCDSAKLMSLGFPVSEDFIFSHGNTPGSGAFLSLVTSRPLSDSGGLVSLITGNPPGGSYLSCCESALQTELMSGMLAAMPEPASLLYVLVGIAALAGMQWTSRRASRVRADQVRG